MSDINELLWNYIAKKQYDEAISLIQATPKDLDLNYIDKLGRSFLMFLLSAPDQQHPKFLPLANDILNSDGFSISAQHINQRTKINAFALAILTGNITLINILLQRPDKLNVIFSGQKLQYSIVMETIKSQSGLLDDPYFADKAQTTIANLEKIRFIIRDFTIRHAIATDNPDIMQALEEAKGEPMAPLSNGDSPFTLSRSDSKVHTWLQELGARSLAGLSGMAENMHTFTKVLAEQNAARVGYHVGLAKIYERGIDEFATLAKKIATAVI